MATNERIIKWKDFKKNIGGVKGKIPVQTNLLEIQIICFKNNMAVGKIQAPTARILS